MSASEVLAVREIEGPRRDQQGPFVRHAAISLTYVETAEHALGHAGGHLFGNRDARRQH